MYSRWKNQFDKTFWTTWVSHFIPKYELPVDDKKSMYFYLADLNEARNASRSQADYGTGHETFNSMSVCMLVIFLQR